MDQYEYVLQVVRAIGYLKWRGHGSQDTIGFWAPRLHEGELKV